MRQKKSIKKYTYNNRRKTERFLKEIRFRYVTHFFPMHNSNARENRNRVEKKAGDRR